MKKLGSHTVSGKMLCLLLAGALTIAAYLHTAREDPGLTGEVALLLSVVLGGLSVYSIPRDILPVFKSPAVQTLVFYGGMPAASIEKNITARLEGCGWRTLFT